MTLWPIAKCSCGSPVGGNGPQVENHCSRTVILSNAKSKEQHLNQNLCTV